MALKQRAVPPIPHDVLADLHGRLAPQYGSVIWDGDGRRTLVARVPGQEPDLVGDLEAIVESGDPADIAGAQACLLIAARGIHQVPVEPLKQMMAARVAFDATQATFVREKLPRAVESTIYRSPADRLRRQRLGIRVPCVRVADIDDAHLEALVEDLGPRLEQGHADIHCVYLVADQDHVRLETGLFAQDLLSKYQDEDRRARIEAARAQEQHEVRRLQEADRAALLHHLEKKFPKNTAYAPLRSGHEGSVDPGPDGEAASEHQTTRATGPSRASEMGAGPSHDRLRGRVDSLPAPKSLAMTDAEEPAPGGTQAVVAGQADLLEGPTDAGETADVELPSTGDDDMDALARRLARSGYDIIVGPPVTRVRLDLAAERPADYPQRIIACRRDRLRPAEAQALLEAARALDVDLVIVVADALDAEAQRLIVATKVKRIRPSDIDDLRL